MIVGIITGTYSSVFVAAAIVTLWKGSGKRPAAAQVEAAAPVEQPSRAQAKRAKANRKARAS